MFIFTLIGNNNHMRSYKYFNKIQNSSSISLLICSLLFVIGYFFDFLSDKFNQSQVIRFDDLSSAVKNIIPYVFCFFLSYSILKGKKSIKAFICTFCLYIFYSAFSERESIIFAIIIPLIAYFCFEKFDFYLSSVLILTVSVIFAVLFNVIYDYYLDIVMLISGGVSNKGVFSSSSFGLINTFLSAFDIKEFQNMFYFKSFGTGTVIDNSVISGAVNLFKSNIISKSVSSFLSGRYYLLFLLSGVFSILLTKVKGISKITLTALFICMLLSGNIGFILLFIFLENVYLFLSVCVLSSLCYLCADIVNLGIGFTLNGSVFEMFAYINKPVYLFSIGIVFFSLGYFVSRYFWEKVGISSAVNVYIPKRLKESVSKLGGVSNILRINELEIEVRNPKMVDTINFDCEVKENKIIVEKSLIDNLKEYLC